MAEVDVPVTVAVPVADVPAGVTDGVSPVWAVGSVSAGVAVASAMTMAARARV